MTIVSDEYRTKVYNETSRAKQSRTCSEIVRLSSEANERGWCLGGNIRKVYISEHAPSKRPKDDGWVEMVAGAILPGIEVREGDGVHRNIPSFVWKTSSEQPRGVDVHIKTATLGGRSRTWIRLTK